MRILLCTVREIITCYKSWKGPIDPTSDKDHGKHVGDIAFHHICQHAGVCEIDAVSNKFTQYVLHIYFITINVQN